jgi:hypothetical protein
MNQRFDLVAYLSMLAGNRWEANSETGHETGFFVFYMSTQ